MQRGIPDDSNSQPAGLDPGRSRPAEVDEGLPKRPLPEFEILDQPMAAIWRQKTGAERIRIASDLFAFARKLTLASVRSMHPDWTPEQVWREAARRLSHGAV